MTLPSAVGQRSSEWRPVAVSHSLRAQVADAVRAALVAGSMTSGEVYSAPQLAERFGVSVTPVREALLELVRDGLLVAVRNRGFRVADPTDLELDATSEVRLLLEPAAAVRAALQPADHRAAAEERLRAAARAVADAADAGDVVAHVRADRDFHAGLLELAGNPVLTETVLRLRDRSRLYGRDGDIAQGTLRQAAIEHERLVDLVLAGDADGARDLMAGHVAHVRAEWSPGGQLGHDRRASSRPEGPTSARSAAARPDAHPSASPAAVDRE